MGSEDPPSSADYRSPTDSPPSAEKVRSHLASASGNPPASSRNDGSPTDSTPSAYGARSLSASASRWHCQEQ